jgi:hypothetical protein
LFQAFGEYGKEKVCSRIDVDRIELHSINVCMDEHTPAALTDR